MEELISRPFLDENRFRLVPAATFLLPHTGILLPLLHVRFKWICADTVIMLLMMMTAHVPLFAPLVLHHPALLSPAFGSPPPLPCSSPAHLTHPCIQFHCLVPEERPKAFLACSKGGHHVVNPLVSLYLCYNWR